MFTRTLTGIGILIETNCECNMEIMFAVSYRMHWEIPFIWKPYNSIQFQGIHVKLVEKMFAVLRLI